jgi:hypothetical protein
MMMRRMVSTVSTGLSGRWSWAYPDSAIGSHVWVSGSAVRLVDRRGRVDGVKPFELRYGVRVASAAA